MKSTNYSVGKTWQSQVFVVSSFTKKFGESVETYVNIYSTDSEEQNYVFVASAERN